MFNLIGKAMSKHVVGTAVMMLPKLTKSETVSNVVEDAEDIEEHVVDEVVVTLGNAVANDPSTSATLSANLVIRFERETAEVQLLDVDVVKLFVVLVVGIVGVTGDKERGDEDGTNKVLEEHACASECKCRKCCR